MAASLITQIDLEPWCAQGPTAQSAETYKRITDALSAYQWPENMRQHEVFLQGSYANSTNIRGDSDVDVVAELTHVFGHGIQDLTPHQKARFHADYSAGSVTLAEFKVHVVAALTAKFGQKVSLGRKCINVGGENERLNADVLAAESYRSYRGYDRPYDSNYVPGLRFYVERDARWVVNYPKLHISNGVDKSKATGDNYKRMIRLFKRARNYLIDNGLLADGITPSYFVECWLYNVAPAHFRSDPLDSFLSILSQLASDYKEGRMDFYICQNGVTLLFGPTEEQWNTDHAAQFLLALLSLLPR